jgi:hypothetical protein
MPIQVSRLIAEALLSALAFAQRTGDTTRVQMLLELLGFLGRERRWAYVKIIRATAPLKPSESGGRVSVKFQKPRERDFDLIGAARSLGLGDRPSDGLDCEHWTTKEFNSRFKELRFYLSRREVFDLRSITNEAAYNMWISGLPRAHPTELLSLFWSCVSTTGGADSAARANKAISALEREWQRRSQASEYFVWPRSFVPPGSGTLDTVDAPDRGIFSALGYRVGKVQGQPTSVRHFVLDYIFFRTLPPLNGPLYMQKWAKPETPRRLQSMAYFLARTSWNAQRRTRQDLTQAISDWTHDLRYLKDRYYRGYFNWP